MIPISDLLQPSSARLHLLGFQGHRDSGNIAPQREPICQYAASTDLLSGPRHTDLVGVSLLLCSSNTILIEDSLPFLGHSRV
jgi:hypothetical protein